MTRDMMVALEPEGPFLWVYTFDSNGHAVNVTERWPFDLVTEQFVWVHLNLADVRSRDWLEKTGMVDPAGREMLLDPREHQQVHGAGQKIWATLADFSRTLDDDGSETAMLRLYVDDRCVVTARKRPMQSCAMTRRRIIGGYTTATPLALFSLLVGNIFGAMDRSIIDMTHSVDEIEDRVLDDRVNDERQRLIHLRRDVVRLHRTVTATHRAFARFDIDESLTGQANSTMHQLHRILDTPHHDLHNLLERCRLLQDELGAKLSSITNRQLYILTILSTALMPPTLVTGFFGMNTKGMLFGEDENGTIYATIAALVAALIAFVVMFMGRWDRSKSGK